MATTSVPPLPPDVTQQQANANPLQQYAAGAAQQGTGVAGQAGPSASLQFVIQGLETIKAKLTEIAQVLSVEKPAIMPIVGRAAGALGLIEKEVQQGLQGQRNNLTAGPEPTQTAMSAPEGQQALGL